ncbi:MAG: 3-dehydroquinate synthase [Lachnospiraceae bacterium]|nr:3-dehydroquinate synthase [Lachnospiraceae bacterium]
MSKIKVSLTEKDNSYEVVIRRGCINDVGQELDLNRKVLIVTDEGVPAEYAEKVAACSGQPFIVTIGEGEEHKSLESFDLLLNKMLQEGFSRKDCVVAVGGGVVGDLAGFAASAYMRGVDFYNIPTTILSQVDSSVGGKTAINYGGLKNIVGAFYQPKRVLIDIDLTKTLTDRQISNGLSEALKMGMTFDAGLVNIFKRDDYMEHLEEIVTRSIELKTNVVEQDEKEAGLRKVLNFGHTIGHGIELATNEEKLYHGECVSIGMVAMSSAEVRKELIPILDRLNLPTSCDVDGEEVYRMMCHDKKASGAMVSAVFCEKVGEYKLQDVTLVSLKDRVRSVTD